MILTPWEDFDKEPKSPFNEYTIPPRIIYHYTSLKTAALIIANQTLNFASPLGFNDPLDMYEKLISYQTDSRTIRPWINHTFPEWTRKKRRDMEHICLTRPDLPEQFRGVVARIKRNSGVCCFSRVPDQVLMWSHYADKHKGVCLGFNIQPVRKNEDFMVFDVNYVDEVKSVKFFSEREKILRHWALTKADAWSYEQEVRAIIRDVKFNRLVPFDKACLKAVYFGCATPKNDIDRINALLKTHHFAVPSVKQMRIDQESFGLKEVDLGTDSHSPTE